MAEIFYNKIDGRRYLNYFGIGGEGTANDVCVEVENGKIYITEIKGGIQRRLITLEQYLTMIDESHTKA